MEIKIDTKSIDRLSEAMGRYARIMPVTQANAALRKAARPMLQRAKMEAPVSAEGEYTPLNKKGRSANAYRKGGSTRRDLRLKAVPPKAGEVGRVLVGVSKKSNSVGWRTVFITKGTEQRKTRKGYNRGLNKPNDFLTKAYKGTILLVSETFKKEYREAFVKWAKSNLPQDKYQ